MALKGLNPVSCDVFSGHKHARNVALKWLNPVSCDVFVHFASRSCFKLGTTKTTLQVSPYHTRSTRPRQPGTTGACDVGQIYLSP